MLAEKEFLLWLRRKEKTFAENLQFALKAWQSAEFTLSNKYELILTWLAEDGPDHFESGDIPTAELMELLQLRAQPILITQPTKVKFVEVVLALSEQTLQTQQQPMPNCRTMPELLSNLLNFEVMQDLFRTDYELEAQLYGALLKHYNVYLLQFAKPQKAIAEDQSVDEKRPQLLAANEADFFSAIIGSLKDMVKRTSDLARCDTAFTAHIIAPLIQVFIILRQHNLNFFEELRTLEHDLNQDNDNSKLFKRIFALPLHVQLITLECAIVDRRSATAFTSVLLRQVFYTLENQAMCQQNPGLKLQLAAHTLEMLRKHDVNLNFIISADPEMSALAFIGSSLLPLVKNHKNEHLKEVLMLLCAALRLNPLILEERVFQVTTWMIVAPKRASNSTDDDGVCQLFEQYLQLLMEMFRRLSQTEKFVSHLLKTLQEWLRKYELPVETTKSITAEELGGKRKAINLDGPSPTPTKKRKKLPEQETGNAEESQQLHYMQLILQECRQSMANNNNTSTTEPACNQIATENLKQSFPELQTHWPSGSVGVAFSRLVAGLVSKPSLVVWKSLLYSLKELIECEKADIRPSNRLFLLDLQAALLSQYFRGARLAEHQQKFSKQMHEQTRFTEEILKQFGRDILAKREYPARIINAFLELNYSFGAFKLLLSYYRPDGLPACSSDDAFVGEQGLHGYLSKKEWQLLQQRTIEGAQPRCQQLFNRLQAQRAEAQILLLPYNPELKENVSLSLSDFLNVGGESEGQQLQEYLLQANNASWLMSRLSAAERAHVVKFLLRNAQPQELANKFGQDLQILSPLVLTIYEELIAAFRTSSKSSNSLLASLNCDFGALLLADDEKEKVWKPIIQSLVEQINARQGDYEVRKLPATAVAEALLRLRHLPVAYLRRPVKNFIFALQLAFYRDLKAVGEDNSAAAEALDILTDLLHFGQHVPVLKYFRADTIMALFPVSQCTELYAALLVAVQNEDKGCEEFLQMLEEIFQKSLAERDGKLSDDERCLLLLTLNTLNELNGRPGFKRLQKAFDGLLQVYDAYVRRHFSGGDNGSERTKKDKKFVQKTVAGFALYASAVLKKSTKASLNKDKGKGADAVLEKNSSSLVVDEEFRRICKIYIGHSLDYRSAHATRLIQVCLHHRQEIHLDQDEIELVLSTLWRQLNADLSAPSTAAPAHLTTAKNTENVVKLIIDNKTNEDLLLTLKDIGHMTQSLKAAQFQVVTGLLGLIGKCPFSTIKGAIFNDQFKQITHEIMLRLNKDERQQFTDTQEVLGLLACQQSVVENKMVAITLDTLDGILGFLVDINIKKFLVKDDNWNVFYELHLAMSQLCSALIKQRHLLLMDRVPQFMHILKDLLQSIVWYKSDRQKGISLTNEELDQLTELAMKLEAMMHLIATHSTHIKRVAPFVLMFTINLMISQKRATTLYSKIKTHIDSICYDLVGVCDHRVGRFILRCSSEAARQVYEQLVKDHKKYHKFKGKV